MHALELGGADEDSDIDLRSVRALAYGSLVLGISAAWADAYHKTRHF